METVDGVALRRLVEEAEKALAQGWSLPYSWIGSPAHFAFETAAILEREWIVAGLERKLPEIGSRLLCRIGRVPAVVVRDDDRRIRAFVNVCRHRGYPVATTEARSRTLMCRYHAWTYALDGSLRRAPGAERLAGFDPAQLGLQELAVAVWQGIVFVNADPFAAPFDELYPELTEVAAAAGLDVNRYEWHSGSTSDVACDWKLLYDNSVECYHCPTMHGDSLNAMYESDDFAAAAWRGRMRYGTSKVKGSNLRHHSIQLFPGTMLFLDPIVGLLGRFQPTGPSSSRLVVDYFSAPGADPAQVDEFVALWRTTLAEDKEILEAQQVGVSCGRLERSRLIPGREDSLPQVQALILAAYRKGLDPKWAARGCDMREPS